MLQKLTIRNYAIIENLTMEPGNGVSIITGETGAGKSILLGALSLILGERADAKSLYKDDEKCIIEACFQLNKKKFAAFFEKEELDFEEQTLIRREITPNGKSRAFINDTPVNLQQLRKLGEQLVNLHSQHETLELIDSGFQLSLVDSLARNEELIKAYRDNFFQFKNLKARLHEKMEAQKRGKAEFDFLQFQFSEIAEARLQPGEQELLEAEHQALSNVDAILRSVQAATLLLEGNEGAAIDQLQEAVSQLKGLAKIHVAIGALSARIDSVSIELKDVVAELEHVAASTSPDPQRLEEISQRLNTIYRLQKKFGYPSSEALLDFQNSLQEKIVALDTSEEAINSLQREVQAAETELKKSGALLHSKRLSGIPSFKKNIEKLLHKAGMPNAVFEVAVAELALENYADHGPTEIDFLFSANKGFAPQPVRKVASGGELSRLMLCIKSQQAGAGNLPTLIFDEIDQGISGEVALRVGEIMTDMAHNHQLICITHLPQIARIADKHFYIYKETVLGKAATKIKVLDQDSRVKEIAKMLGGNKVSEAALANARELLRNSN